MAKPSRLRRGDGGQAASSGLLPSAFLEPLSALAAQQITVHHRDHVHIAADLGELGVAPHGHGWPVTANLLEWRWTCD